MAREINYNVTSPTSVNFKLSRYVIYFNPYIFLNLTAGQMKSTIKHEIIIIECDTEIRQSYKVKFISNIRARSITGGGTKFTPVFRYVNNTDTNILIYFTDGKGEESLSVMPKGYKVLWVISRRGDKLSLKEPFGTLKKLKPVEIKEDTVDRIDVINDGFSMNNHEPIY